MAELPLKGRDLQRAVIDMARRFGWRVAHFASMQGRDGIWRTPAQADGKGWPDLVLVRDRLVVAEIKGDNDRLKREQEEWLSAIRMAGIPAYVWTSKEWASGEIENVLRARKQEPYPPYMRDGTGLVVPCT